MSDSTGNQNDGLWGRETRLPTLTSQNTDRRPPTAPTVTAQQRAQQLAVQQQMRASAARRDDERSEDREVDDRDHEPVAVRVQWEHTTRYEADLAVDPWLNDEELLTRLDALPDADRRVINVVDGDNLVSVVDLDGDGHIDAYEMSAGMVTDWGDIADGIDERIAESPTWPALNAALVTAAARDGYDVAANLPQVASESPLPTHDPAGELYYRLLNSGAVDVGADSAAGSGAQPPPRRDESASYGADAPRISAPAV
jgi:hypothetical protein